MRCFRMEFTGVYLDAGFPSCTYMELDDDWFQLRVLELFADKDGGLHHVNYADSLEQAGARLAEGCFLEIDRISGQVCFQPVTRVEFETMWNQRSRLRKACTRLQQARKAAV